MSMFNAIPQSSPWFFSTSGHGNPANYTLFPGQQDLNVYVSPYGRFGTQTSFNRQTGDTGLNYYNQTQSMTTDYGMPVAYNTSSNNAYYPTSPGLNGFLPVGYFNGRMPTYQTMPPLYFPNGNNPYGRSSALNGYPVASAWMQDIPFI